MPDWIANVRVAVRNMIWPGLLTTGISLLMILRKKKVIKWLVLIIIILDLFRFGWKYTPFVTKEFVYPETEITKFLTNQEGLFRAETKKGPILPANTWTMYGLYSASGYDPLAPRDYTLEYGRQLNGSAVESRYALLDYYDPVKLGEFNVKYLLVDKEYFTKGIKEWKTAFETEKMMVLENPEFKERVEWFGKQEAGNVEVLSYTPNEVRIGYRVDEAGRLVVRDSWDEGWRVWVNGEEKKSINIIECLERLTLRQARGR